MYICERKLIYYKTMIYLLNFDSDKTNIVKRVSVRRTYSLNRMIRRILAKSLAKTIVRTKVPPDENPNAPDNVRFDSIFPRIRKQKIVDE